MMQKQELTRMLLAAERAELYFRAHPEELKTRSAMAETFEAMAFAIARELDEQLPPETLRTGAFNEIAAWRARAESRLASHGGRQGFQICRQTPNDADLEGLLPELMAESLDFPHEISIETTGVCNAHCTFCTHDQLARRKMVMSDALFSKILSDLEQIPQKRRFLISPFKVNEILMDKKFFERMREINERLPNALIRIFSNLNAATKDDIRALCKIKNLYNINISLNSLDPVEYRELMGLPDLQKTIDNIKFLLRLIQTEGLRLYTPKITLSRVSTPLVPEADVRFLGDCKREFAEFEGMLETYISMRGEWIDYMPNQHPAKQRVKCARWAYLDICCDGKVAFCCMDGDCRYSLGDVNRQSVLEIYNSPLFRSLRETEVIKNEVTPCHMCSLY